MRDESSKRRQRERRRRRQELERALKRTASARAEGESSAAQAEGKQRGKIEEKDITGLKYFEKLNPLLDCLQEAGCERDKANNRELHFDQYCMLILLYLFNRIVEVNSSYVCRLRDNSAYEVLEERPLTDADRQAGLLSDHPNGIEIQTYCAIIACLLISLWTGRKPTLRTYEMICFYFCGMATEEELQAHIAKLKRHPEAMPRI